ncbi:MAG: hypothetical protein LBF63_09795 [Treponema sp.]|jgi:hypothetical protein|nr:hypothetical protein [Treponema sp.]
MKTVQDYMNDPRLLNDPGMAEAFFAPMRKTLCYDLAGRGKLKPRQPVTQ